MKKYCILTVNNLFSNDNRFNIVETDSNCFDVYHNMMKTGKIFGFAVYTANDNHYEFLDSFGNLAFICELYKEDLEYFSNN